MEIAEVVDKGKDFLFKSGYFSSKLLKIVLDKSTKIWHLEFDVGALVTVVVILTIDDESGRIVGFERKSD